MGRKPYSIDQVLTPFRKMCESGLGGFKPRDQTSPGAFGQCLMRLLAGRYPTTREAAERLAELYDRSEPVEAPYGARQLRDPVGAAAWFDRELPEFMALVPEESRDLVVAAATEIRA